VEDVDIEAQQPDQSLSKKKHSKKKRERKIGKSKKMLSDFDPYDAHSELIVKKRYQRQNLKRAESSDEDSF